MLKALNVENSLLEKYYDKAKQSFDYNFVNKEHILALAQEAEIPQESKDFLSDFLDWANDDILLFIWLFYYVQFETEEDFKFDIWQLDKIPMPAAAEEKFKGAIKLAVYLLSAENLKKWVAQRGLEQDIVQSYFERLRYILELNFFDSVTRGMARLSPFLWGYSKPVSMRLGRLAFQLKGFADIVQVYKNRKGEHLLVATQKYKYDQDGLVAQQGKTPIYKKNENTLICQSFGNDGRLLPNTMSIDLNEYSLWLKENDPVVTIHIPDGGKLSQESVIASIARAKEIYGTYYPEYKAFVCRTWFIDPALRGEVIKEGSNMASFADMFDLVCAEDQNNHSIFEHVFKVERQPLENLVPQNSFQEKLLNRALRGERIFWTLGILKKEFNK